MKTKYLLSPVVMLFVVFANASNTDNSSLPSPDQAYDLQLLPALNVLYFNQAIDFQLPQSSSFAIDHVDFKRGSAIIYKDGFRLNIDYANRLTATEVLKVFVRDSKGNVTLAYEKSITLKQKLNEYLDKTVANDEDLFMLDGVLQVLENTASKVKLQKAEELSINPERFNAGSIRLQSFDLSIRTSIGTSVFHSDSGKITAEMKAAIGKLSDGDFVTFENLFSEYIAEHQKVPMRLNYSIKYKIGNDG